MQVLDKLQQKNIENEKLRLELGSDYESSSDSSMFEELDFKKSDDSNQEDYLSENDSDPKKSLEIPNINEEIEQKNGNDPVFNAFLALFSNYL